LLMMTAALARGGRICALPPGGRRALACTDSIRIAWTPNSLRTFLMCMSTLCMMYMSCGSCTQELCLCEDRHGPCSDRRALVEVERRSLIVERCPSILHQATHVCFWHHVQFIVRWLSTCCCCHSSVASDALVAAPAWLLADLKLTTQSRVHDRPCYCEALARHMCKLSMLVSTPPVLNSTVAVPPPAEASTGSSSHTHTHTPST
jgi:hypothetical protein